MSAVRKSDRMLKIMAYADGELEGAEREEVEAWIAEDASSVRFANDLAGLGELVQLGHKTSKDAKTIASFDIADAVMARVAIPGDEAQVVVVKERKNETKADAKPAVLSLDAARARRQKNLKLGGIAAAALALAASVFLMTRNKEEQPMARAPIPVVQPAPTQAQAQPTTNMNGNGGSVDVDVEQSAGTSVSVFYVPAEDLSTSVLVWVDETGGK